MLEAWQGDTLVAVRRSREGNVVEAIQDAADRCRYRRVLRLSRRQKLREDWQFLTACRFRDDGWSDRLMEKHQLGTVGDVSVLTLGGGGLGKLWGPTTREEAIATARLAVDRGITLLDMAPRYGDGEAEAVIGEAFEGRLPEGVRVTSKCLLGDTAPGEIESRLRQSIEESLTRLKVDHIDLFFLHSNICPDEGPLRSHPLAASRMTPVSNYREYVVPVFETLVREGKIGAWGITGIGYPDTLIDVLGDETKPAAIQCIATCGQSWRAEVFRGADESARDRGNGRGKRRGRDGHPGCSRRRADGGGRPSAAG